MCSCRCGIVVVVELLGSMHGWAGVGADMLLLSMYCGGKARVCNCMCGDVVVVELVSSWS